MHFTPGLRLRCNDETEIVGMDDAEMGEYAYDYVSVLLEINPRRMYGDDTSSTRSMRQRRGAIPSIVGESQHNVEVHHPPEYYPTPDMRSV
jgi:Amt family ammonium transporter